MRGALGDDITGVCSQTENGTRQLHASFEELKHGLERQKEISDEGGATLRSVSSLSGGSLVLLHANSSVAR